METIVYKLGYFGSSMIKGRVVKETPKQYRVQEFYDYGQGRCGYSTRVSTWQKSECYCSIEEAASALIAKAHKNVECKQNQLDYAIQQLEKVQTWARQEFKESQATDA